MGRQRRARSPRRASGRLLLIRASCSFSHAPKGLCAVKIGEASRYMVRKTFAFRDFTVRAAGANMPLAFGGCVLDLETRELRRGGALVHLAPQVYRLLEVLIERRPRVVKKNELDEILWPKSYVARSSLGRVVAELRDALGDDAHEPQIVRTVHAVGYAFCADVANVGTTTTSTATRAV